MILENGQKRLVVINSRRQALQIIATVWDRDERYQLQGMAKRLFVHEHGVDEDNSRISSDPLIRDNCGACALNKPWGKKRFQAPNYSGWERVYIEAGKHVPANYLYRALTGENRHYAEALARDLVTFYEEFETPALYLE